MMKYIVLIALILTSCSTVHKDIPDLKVGKISLKQRAKIEKLRPGLFYIQIKRGAISPIDYHTLSSGIISEERARILTGKIKEFGLSSRIEFSPESNPHGHSLGVIVRTGKFKRKKDALDWGEKLQQQGIDMAIRHTSEDGNPTTGPFKISLLEIDLDKYKGNIKAALGKNKIQGKELTSNISKQNNAIAAVNAGFFAWDPTVGVPGDPAGISVIDGNLVSEATNGRAALIIDNNVPKHISVAHNLKTMINIRIGDSIFKANGINRSLGKILNCGNIVDPRTEIPAHDFVCQNENEIVIFTAGYSSKGDVGEGLEIAVDKMNKIISIANSRGGKIPVGGYLIQAIGQRVKQLHKHMKVGMRATLNVKITSDEGPIELKKGLYAINGGPTLLRNGEMLLSDRYKEGWETQFQDFKVSDEFVDKKDKAAIKDSESSNRSGFYHGWVVRRHPRTAIGITKDNKVYVAVVYGRQPGVSAGASVTEMSNLLQSLGAVEAFNLDGGGSSMMVVKGHKTGKSSDETGERAIGDALIFTD